MAELGGARPPRRRPATSLNRPVGPRRRRCRRRRPGHPPGPGTRARRHRQRRGARRGRRGAANPADRARRATLRGHHHGPGGRAAAATGGALGNQIGIMPVTVPATGDFGTRVTRTAAITRERKSRARRASAALFVPAFLLLARTGLLRWFASHQRVVQTFVTNLHGPEDPLTFGGAAVRAIIPIPSTTGNVTVTFGGSVLRRNAVYHYPVGPGPHARRPRPSRRPPPRTVRPAAVSSSRRGRGPSRSRHVPLVPSAP